MSHLNWRESHPFLFITIPTVSSVLNLNSHLLSLSLSPTNWSHWLFGQSSTSDIYIMSLADFFSKASNTLIWTKFKAKKKRLILSTFVWIRVRLGSAASCGSRISQAGGGEGQQRLPIIFDIFFHANYVKLKRNWTDRALSAIVN